MAVSITEYSAKKRLIVCGSDSLYYEDINVAAGKLVKLTASDGDIDTSDNLMIVSGFQKAFVINGTNLKVADFINTKISTDNIGTHPPDKGNILTGQTSGAKMVVDYITSLSGTCTIYGYRTTAATFVDGETVTGTDDDGNSISFDLNADEVAGPHWYDWTVYGNSDAFGTMPSSAYLGCLYRGRLVLAGNKAYPHQWYMSRVGNPWDWVYGANDPLSAVAGNNADAGEAGDIITALIPYRDDYLIFGCANSIWLLRGDPASGGSLDRITGVTGIFGSQSWCWGPDNSLYFVGSGGIYRALPPTFETIECISVPVLPNLISDWQLDPALHRVVMGYDARRFGILICRTTLSDGSSSAYWYDLRTEGFFPESYPNECGPYSMLFYDANDDDHRRLLLGCKDGYIRYFDDAAKDDDIGATDTAINSHVTLPIVKAGNDDEEGKLTSLTITLAGGAAGGSFGDTDGVDYKIYAADDPETVLEDIKDGAAAKESGTLSGTGRQNRIRKRVRGRAIGIRLENTNSNETWAVEKVVGRVIPAGRE